MGILDNNLLMCGASCGHEACVEHQILDDYVGGIDISDVDWSVFFLRLHSEFDRILQCLFDSLGGVHMS